LLGATLSDGLFNPSVSLRLTAPLTQGSLWGAGEALGARRTRGAFGVQGRLWVRVKSDIWGKSFWGKGQVGWGMGKIKVTVS